VIATLTLLSSSPRRDAAALGSARVSDLSRSSPVAQVNVDQRRRRSLVTEINTPIA
jgi:hypothetical protein